MALNFLSPAEIKDISFLDSTKSNHIPKLPGFFFPTLLSHFTFLGFPFCFLEKKAGKFLGGNEQESWIILLFGCHKKG
jgi:hypothetical protein